MAKLTVMKPRTQRRAQERAQKADKSSSKGGGSSKRLGRLLFQIVDFCFSARGTVLLVLGGWLSPPPP